MTAIGVQMEAVVVPPPGRTDIVSLFEHCDVETGAAHRRGTGKPGRARTDKDRVGVLQQALRLSPPDLLRHFDRQPKLCPLLFFGEDVALLGGGKSALRR